MSDRQPHVSGFVSIVGRPNAGKSTLLNAITGAKLAIVTDKPQTTRTSVQGVYTTDNAQVVFIDTPGIHKSDTLFNRRMMVEVRSALEERDLLLYLIDATRRFTDEDSKALDMIRKSGTPAFLVLNKIDLIREKRRLLPLIEQYKSAFEFEEYIPISAATGEGIDTLLKALISRLPEGPACYSADEMTNQPERFLAAELVREKVLLETRQEVPHSIAVMVDKWEEEPPGLTRIAMTIYVEREGQKGIVIGKQGAMLKKIGTLARTEIEDMLGRKVFLELFVKVRENWRESPEFLSQLDWRGMVDKQ
jgi:GTP-binding protein Era